MVRLALVTVLILGANCIASATDDIAYGSNAKAGQFAKIGDVTLYYETYGSGHPLLLLHGNRGEIASFKSLIPELSNHFKVIAVDSRAHGKSTDSEKDISYTLLASDISGLLKALGVDDAFFLGWSDGGIVGLEIAYHYPNQISKLIAFNPNFRPGSELFDWAKELGKPYDPNALSENMRKIRQEIRDLQADQAQPRHTKEVQRKLKKLVEKYPDFSVPQLAKVETPTLVMVGDHDLIPHEHTLALFNALPHSHLAVLPGATHLFPNEKPSLTIQLVVDFLTTDYYDVDPFYFARPKTSKEK